MLRRGVVALAARGRGRPRVPARGAALPRSAGSASRCASSTTSRAAARVDGGAGPARPHGGPTRTRRSLVANLQGALAFEEARDDSGQAAVLLRRSLTSFRRAIALDRRNEDAKYNLELVLRLLEQAERRRRAGRRAARRHAGRAARARRPPEAATERMPDITFLTPAAASSGSALSSAIAVLLAAEARRRRRRAALGLVPRAPRCGRDRDRRARARRGPARARGGAAGRLAGASRREAATDAEALFVFDISRSMVARQRAAARRRGSRARATAAKELRAAMPEVPVGVASVTDRVLPHLFPTTSANAFTATVDRAIGIERPPPDRSGRGRVTAFGSLAGARDEQLLRRRRGARGSRSSSPTARPPVRPRDAARAARRGRVRTTSSASGTPTSASTTQRGRQSSYRPSAASRSVLDRVVREIGGGVVVSEQEVEAAVSAAKARLGAGSDRDARPGAPGGLAGAVRRCCGCVSVALVLLRRNSRRDARLL